MSKKIDNFIRAEMKNIKARKSDLEEFGLEIEKDVRPRPPTAPSPQGPDDHPMGKYC